MSRKYLATAGWLVAVTLAFGLGWGLRPAPEATGPSADGGTRLVGKASPVSSIPDPGKKTVESFSDAVESGTGLVVLEARRVLTTADIEDLGMRFKTSLDPIERRLAFAQLLEGLTVDNALEIRRQIEDLPADSSEFREFHFAWGKIGGVGAVMNGAATDKADMAATLGGWASADPAAAMAWLKNLDMANDRGFDVLLKDRGIPIERMQGHLVDGMVHGLASTDPDLAAKFVFELAAAGNPKAEGLLGIVTSNILRSKSPVEAAAWAERLPEGGMRSAAMGRVAYEYARQDPVAAAAWAGAHVYEENGGHLVYGITKQWARRDGEAAVAWLDSLGDTPGRSGAYYSAFEGWAGQDAVAASSYLSGMAESPARDSAISGLVTRVRWEDPEASIAWADSISSEKARLEAITRAGQAWTVRDPAAAAEWARSSGLPEKMQQAIVNPPRKKK